jgi:hypothetical protein
LFNKLIALNSLLEEDIMKDTLYQVGDKLLVRSDLQIHPQEYKMHYTGIAFDCTKTMIDMGGKVVTVKDIDCGTYIIAENSGYYWTDEMFVGKVVDIKDYMDLNVGDTVLIRDDLEHGVDYKGGISTYISYDGEEAMLIVKGQLATIVHNYNDGDIDIDLLNNDYLWGYGMFEGKVIKRENVAVVVEEENGEMGGIMVEKNPVEVVEVNALANFSLVVEKVIFSEPATVLFYRVPDMNMDGHVEGVSDLKKVVAKCSPEDTYDKNQGMHVALLKATVKEAKKQIKLI